ncbi:MAG: hypothetical protein JWO80_5962 [Bryobacterales bacterium]|nr:hypothetical protein [Bryobacterales bacterium]
MSSGSFTAACLLAVSATAATFPLPELRIEPTAGGSIFYVRNPSPQPLTAYLIELVNYPGSSYSLWQDDVASEAIPPGGQRRTQVANMTVGAVPDYVKMQAALYADGSSAGIAEKVTQLIERRRAILATERELIGRLEKAQSSGADKATVIGELRQWAASLQPAGKGNRVSQAAVNQAAGRGLVSDAASRLDTTSIEETLNGLRASERALAASKPSL